MPLRQGAMVRRSRYFIDEYNLILYKAYSMLNIKEFILNDSERMNSRIYLCRYNMILILTIL